MSVFEFDTNRIIQHIFILCLALFNLVFMSFIDDIVTCNIASLVLICISLITNNAEDVCWYIDTLFCNALVEILASFLPSCPFFKKMICRSSFIYSEYKPFFGDMYYRYLFLFCDLLFHSFDTFGGIKKSFF